MDKATSLITQFSLTKTQIAHFVEKSTGEILAGDYDPLIILARLKAMEECIAGVRKNILSAAFDEAAKYPEKSINVAGINFAKSSRKTYDYSNSAAWVDINTKRKELEAMLKNLTAPVADPETGELMYPATWSQTDILSITLPE